MTSIFNHNVQTYVRELISKEFGSVSNEEKSPSENRKSINCEHQKQQKQTAVYGQQMKEQRIRAQRASFNFNPEGWNLP